MHHSLSRQSLSLLYYSIFLAFFCFVLLDESVTVKCPPFAESISEGDVRWEKGNKYHF